MRPSQRVVCCVAAAPLLCLAAVPLLVHRVIVACRGACLWARTAAAAACVRVLPSGAVACCTASQSCSVMLIFLFLRRLLLFAASPRAAWFSLGVLPLLVLCLRHGAWARHGGGPDVTIQWAMSAPGQLRIAHRACEANWGLNWQAGPCKCWPAIWRPPLGSSTHTHARQQQSEPTTRHSSPFRGLVAKEPLASPVGGAARPLPCRCRAPPRVRAKSGLTPRHTSTHNAPIHSAIPHSLPSASTAAAG